MYSWMRRVPGPAPTESQPITLGVAAPSSIRSLRIAGSSRADFPLAALPTLPTSPKMTYPNVREDSPAHLLSALWLLPALADSSPIGQWLPQPCEQLYQKKTNHLQALRAASAVLQRPPLCPAASVFPKELRASHFAWRETNSAGRRFSYTE